MASTSSASAGARPALLVVDDDPLILEALGAAFEDRFAVFCAKNQREARSAVRQMPDPPEYAVVDLGLPPSQHSTKHGLAVIKDVLAAAPECALVVVSGQDSERNAKLARTMGAAEFIAKPAEPDAILRALDVAKRAQAQPGDAGFVGESPAIKSLRERIEALAGMHYSVLIQGETGAGKELAARALHALGGVRGEFLALNCAAIPGQLFEATLYGHRRGAFTGATTDSAGYFGDADGGTLFLDEIGEMVPELQPKLLRTLETGEYQRVGETTTRNTSARVVAATNRDLARDVRARRFREDLYHRLEVLTLRVPPLRNLGDDRFLLLDHFAGSVARQLRGERFRLDGGARAMWASYRFPGNVRELRNIVVRLQAKYPGQDVSEGGLREELYLDGQFAKENPGLLEFSAVVKEQIGDMLRTNGPLSLERATRDFRRACVAAALDEANGDRTAAANLLETAEDALDSGEDPRA